MKKDNILEVYDTECFNLILEVKEHSISTTELISSLHIPSIQIIDIPCPSTPPKLSSLLGVVKNEIISPELRG